MALSMDTVGASPYFWAFGMRKVFRSEHLIRWKSINALESVSGFQEEFLEGRDWAWSVKRVQPGLEGHIPRQLVPGDS